MADVWELLAVIGAAALSATIAAIAAVFGYRHVSKARRDFERDRTKFHEKLKVFKELLESLDGVLIAITAFKQFATYEWRTETTQELNESILTLMTLVAQTKQKEKTIGGSATREIASQYNKFVGSAKGSEDEINEAAEQWLSDSMVSLNLTFLRLLDYHSGRLLMALDTMDILTEDADVRNAAGAVHTWLLGDMAELVTFMGRESFPLIRREEIMAKLPQFDILAGRLKLAMREDLDDTLSSEG